MKIVEEWPFAYVVSSSRKSTLCHFCFKRQKNLQRCSSCRFAHYCGSNCQTLAWNDHRTECERLKSVYPNVPPEMTRLVARILFKLNDITTDSASSSLRNFEDLMSHKTEITSDHVQSEHFTTMCYILKLYLGDLEYLTAGMILDVFGKVKINSFSILDSDLNSIGTGLYLNLSIMNHSCDPDCVIGFEGPKAIVNNIKPDIKSNVELENLTISYIELLKPTSERQLELKAQYYFTCQCKVCLDVENDMLKTGLKCTSPDCNEICVILNETEILCKKCRLKTENVEKIENANTIMGSVKWQKEKLEQLYKESKFNEVYDKCKEILHRCDDGLHSKNIYRVWIVNLIFDSCIELQKFTEAELFIYQTIEPYIQFYPKNHPNVGVQFLKWGRLLLYLKKDDNASIALQKSESILGVCYGKTNDSYKIARALLQQMTEEKNVNYDRNKLEEYFSIE